MNPLTNVRNQNLMNDREINLGIAGTKQSWHREYKDSAWVFIGGLPYDLTEGDVICVFSQYGEVVNINLVRDKKTGKSKGYCFLCYEDQRSTDLAVDNFNGAKVLGRTLKVDHVSNYRMPKDHGEEDEITVALREGGCAPQPIGESDSEDEEELMPLLPLETKKKKKKKKEKKNKKHKRRKTSSSEQSTDDEKDVRGPKVKKEKHAKRYYSDNESLSTSSDDYRHKTNKKPKKLSEKPKLKEVRHDSDSDDSVESHNGGSKNSSSRQRSEDMSLGTKTKSGRYHDERQDRSNDYGRSTTEHNRSRHGSRSVERMRVRDGDRDRQRDEDMSREKYRSREQNRPRAWSRERNSPMGQSRERKRSRDRSNEMHRSRDWSLERHTSRERNRSREINRFGERDRSKYDSNRNRDYHGHRRH